MSPIKRNDSELQLYFSFTKVFFASDFEYIEDVKGYTTSSHKKPMLVDQRGYVYQRIMVSKKSPRAYWGCEKRRQKLLPCSAKVVTLHNKIISMKGTHNHSPPSII